MELQLGLSLSSNATFGLDLNSNAYEPKEAAGSSQVSSNGHQAMWLELGSPPYFSSTTSSNGSTAGSDNNQNEEAGFHAGGMPLTFPPSDRKNQSSNEEEEEDEDKDEEGHDDGHLSKTEENSDDGVARRQPIKYGRKKIVGNKEEDHSGEDFHGRPSNYVKVKMDGVAIWRKINLGLYGSFEDLKDNLHGMFGIPERNSSIYKLIYQDKEGDWQPADGASWRNFIWSVQRLQLMKK